MLLNIFMKKNQGLVQNNNILIMNLPIFKQNKYIQKNKDEQNAEGHQAMNAQMNEKRISIYRNL